MKKKVRVIIFIIAIFIVVLASFFVGSTSYIDYKNALEIPDNSDIFIKQYSSGETIELQKENAKKC